MKKRYLFWIVAILVVAALAFLGLLPKLLGFLSTLIFGAALATHSGIDATGKSLGFSPEEEVPDGPRREPGGVVSPPPKNDEDLPLHPTNRGSD